MTTTDDPTERHVRHVLSDEPRTVASDDSNPAINSALRNATKRAHRRGQVVPCSHCGCIDHHIADHVACARQAAFQEAADMATRRDLLEFASELLATDAFEDTKP